MITGKLKTAVEFAKSLRTSGALYETSRKVELEISNHISDAPNKVYVEFGLGHGNITREVLSRMHSSSQLISFEVNKDFVDFVEGDLDDPRLRIINLGAQHIATSIVEKVDGIVSSIPLTIIPKQIRIDILQKAYEALHPGGYYSQILYSKRMLKKFNEIFDHVEVVKNVNLPMEYIHHCRKKE